MDSIYNILNYEIEILALCHVVNKNTDLLTVFESSENWLLVRIYPFECDEQGEFSEIYKRKIDPVRYPEDIESAYKEIITKLKSYIPKVEVA